MVFKNYYIPADNIFSQKKMLLILVAVVFFLGNCKTPYEPKIKASGNDYLVVEGFINGRGTTTITLTRTRNITTHDTATVKYELNATVTVEDQENHSYMLSPAGNGSYRSDLLLSPSSMYRIHIRTADNKEYVSDFVPYKESPPIDNLSWEIKEGGVQINLDTHDSQNKSRYYRWEFTETWEFHSRYLATVKYNSADTTVIPRTDQVYACWRSGNSTSILLGSSAKLKDDNIYHAPVQYIPPQDKRISVLYSILVNQYVLDTLGYNYWTAMKSNTENVGSIFDPQPNQTRGNIHCVTDPSELVIGYISAGSIEQYRMFISNSSLPEGWNPIPNCTEIDVPPNRDTLYYYFQVYGFLPYDIDSTPAGIVKKYPSASASCVDCTLTGTNVKPSFWP